MKPTYQDLEEQLRRCQNELRRTRAQLDMALEDAPNTLVEDQRYLRVLNRFPAIIYVKMSDGKLGFVNSFCISLFGDGAGKAGDEYFWNGRFFRDPTPEIRENDSSAEVVWEMITADGTRHFSFSTYPLGDGADTPLLVIGTEVTPLQNSRLRLEGISRELNNQLKRREEELRRKNIALAEILGQLDIEKQNLANNVEMNVQKVLLPVIEKLIEKSSSLDSRYLLMIKQNLHDLTSSFGIKLSSLEYNLTPREIELCALIRGGFTVKEIATMHNLSERTVETHRLNIRKKLGLSSTKINLSAYLAQIEER